MRHPPHTMPRLETLCELLHFVGLALVTRLSLSAIKPSIACLFTRRGAYSFRMYDNGDGARDEKAYHSTTATRRQMRLWLLIALVVSGCAVAFVRATRRHPSDQRNMEPWVQCICWVGAHQDSLRILTD